MLTLVEFLEPLKTKSLTAKSLAVLYYEARYKQNNVLKGSEIKSLLRSARVPKLQKANITATLIQVGALVDSPGMKDGERIWKLTETGSKHVRDLLGLASDEPEIQHDTRTLEKLLTKVKNPDERDYLQEAVTCLKVGALRAAVIFTWTAAIRNVQMKSLRKCSALNAAILRRDPRARNVSSIDDFAYIKDSTVLFASQDVGIHDKNQREVLEECLKLRNKCGHPGKYSPKEKRVSSFIEDVVSVVFT